MEGDKPGAGGILVGIFLILFGLCIALAGGACTIFWAAFMFQRPNGSLQFGFDSFGILMLLLGVALLLVGIFFIHTGVRLSSGRSRREPDDAGGEENHGPEHP